MSRGALLAGAALGLATSGALAEDALLDLAYKARVVGEDRLTRRSALGRLAWTDPAAGGWSASIDWLHSLDDGGWAATAAVGWEADRLRIDAGLRRYGGKPDSAYRLLPERGLLFFGASLAF